MAKNSLHNKVNKNTVNISYHGSSPFLAIYGGLRKHAMGMQHS